MTKTQHKKTAVASMFQNGISRNTKCAERDSFHRVGHKYNVIITISYITPAEPDSPSIDVLSQYSA